MKINPTKYEKPSIIGLFSEKTNVLNNVDTVTPDPQDPTDPDPTTTSEVDVWLDD